MCSINGITKEDKELVARMNRVTAHRGPDATRVYSASGITLGHNRLSIIDPTEQSTQPMQNEKGDLTIVFNGEIFNYRELKSDKLSTYRYKTASDTEVLLAAYEKWGVEMLSHIEGIFAFALWDLKKKRLLIARDKAGIKPLYYYHKDKTFLFASEIKALLEYGMDRKLNKEALSFYLRLLYVPEPMTMFQDIYKFPHGQYGLVDLEGNFSLHPYNVNKKIEEKHVPYKESFRDSRTELQEVVDRSIKKQLVSDKPVGIYLSGGIDSSVVLDSMSRSTNHIQTFSVGFDDEDLAQKDRYNKDFVLARKTAKYYGATHHECYVSRKSLPEIMEKALWHLDEPIANPTVVPMMHIAKYAKEYVDVVLGGDELFGGYPRYQRSLLATHWQSHTPAFVRDFLAKKGDVFKKLNTKVGTERFAQFMTLNESDISGLYKKDVGRDPLWEYYENRFFGSKTERSFFENQFMYANEHDWLVDESLLKTDKISMAYGLEARAPLLDVDISKFAHALPLSYKVTLRQTKRILKEGFRQRLPPYLFGEPKRGWISPAAKWLRYDDIGVWARSILSAPYYTETSTLFDWEEVSHILERHISGDHYALGVIWSLLSFQIWARVFNVQVD